MPAADDNNIETLLEFHGTSLTEKGAHSSLIDQACQNIESLGFIPKRSAKVHRGGQAGDQPARSADKKNQSKLSD